MINCEIKKCLLLSFAILLADLGLVGLVSLGLDIPGVRQIVGFIFLTFIPGILILRILKIYNMNAIENIVYSAGLSLAFVIFSGVFANFVLPLVGISKPMSILPITATLAIFTLILGAIAYKRDKDFSAAPMHFNMGEFFSLPYLFLFLLPVLAVFGAHLVNLYQNDFLLLFFIIIICCIVALVAFDRLPRNAYPLAIVMIGVSLLLHVSLISTQLFGADIHLEYYLQNLVTHNGYWDFTIPHNYNTALSVVLLCPVFSLLLNMDALWVFKVIYPMFFCLVPLALFHIYREQIGGKKAFFSAFFFMAMMVFFTEMVQLARQQIAELFFALLILLMVDRRLALSQRLSLFIIFSLSLIASHYTMGYICLAFLAGSWIIVALIRSKARVIWEWLTSKFGGLPEEIASEKAFPSKIMAVIMVIYLVFMLGWYGAIAQGTALNTMARVGQADYSLLSAELYEIIQPTPTSKFFEPTKREALVSTALGLDFLTTSGWGKGFRVFQYITQLLVIAGFIGLFLRPKGFKAEYLGLTAVAATILFACIAIPGFSSHINLTRFYHICLFLLAPLCISGGEIIWSAASKLARSTTCRIRGTIDNLTLPQNSSLYFKLLALAVLIPYFLFNTGFVFEVGGCRPNSGIPVSIAISSDKQDEPIYNQKEGKASAWLASMADDNTPVYADSYGRYLLLERFFKRTRELSRSGKVAGDAYIFLRSWNVEKQEWAIAVFDGVQLKLDHINLGDMPSLFTTNLAIYNNGSAQILTTR